MSRVITFSRTFPVKHPRAGESTLFVEQIWNSFSVEALDQTFYMPFEEDLFKLNPITHSSLIFNFQATIAAGRTALGKKHTTIRAGNRWKVGDKFSPRVWSGKPYASKQIQFAPDIEIKKIWSITKRPHEEKGFAFHINGHYVADWEVKTANIMLEDLARNDGLEKEDFVNWFPETFDGQILAWGDVNYY